MFHAYKEKKLACKGLKVGVVLLSLTLLSSCGNHSSEPASLFKNMENRYSAKSLLDISSIDYEAIDTTSIPEIRKNNLYYGRNVVSHHTGYEPIEDIFIQDKLENLIKVLEDNGIASSTTVTNATAIVGDTFEANLPDGKKITVRMIGIDAPKKGMPYYEESIKSLNECIQHTPKMTLILPKTNSKIEKGGGVLGHAFSGKISCNQYQLANGGAMFYKPKFYDLFDFQLGNFYYLDKMSQDNYIGLWGERFPTQPWVSKYKSKDDY